LNIVALKTWEPAEESKRREEIGTTLSFAGIIQIRYGGYLSPGHVVDVQDP
jgi:hypothetical protein